MARKSGTERTMEEIKKELKPFADIYKSLDKAVRKAELEDRKRKLDKNRPPTISEMIYNSIDNKIREYDKKKELKKQNEARNQIIYKCSNCGTEIKPTAIICPNCGARFDRERTEIYNCSYCHKRVNKNDTKCPHCGAMFVKEKSMTPERKKLIDTLQSDIMRKDFEKLTKEELAEEIKSIRNTINDIINRVDEYLSKKQNELNERKYNTYKNKIKDCNKKLDSIEKRVDSGLNKEKSKIEYNKTVAIYHLLNKLHREMIGAIEAKPVSVSTIYNKSANIEKEYTEEEYYEEEPYSNQKQSNHDIVYDELEDYQKREVDGGNYDSYNFEEEELEEDDYFYEDDE